MLLVLALAEELSDRQVNCDNDGGYEKHDVDGTGSGDKVEQIVAVFVTIDWTRDEVGKDDQRNDAQHDDNLI